MVFTEAASAGPIIHPKPIYKIWLFRFSFFFILTEFSRDNSLLKRVDTHVDRQSNIETNTKISHLIINHYFTSDSCLFNRKCADWRFF